MFARAVVAGARQSADVDGTAHGEIADLGMLRAPVLHEEPVVQAATDVAEHQRVGGRVEAGIVAEALEEHTEPGAEVAGAEVVEAGFSTTSAISNSASG
ncbi:MAG: hypothetical protein U0W40_20705 [Acidimicrobiia bacterium]